MLDRIDIKKTMCPYSFDIVLNGKLYGIRVDYNATGDFFALTLEHENEIICTEPLVYGVYLFEDIYSAGKYPAMYIIPWDESNEQSEVNFKTLNETVFLCIDD